MPQTNSQFLREIVKPQADVDADPPRDLLAEAFAIIEDRPLPGRLCRVLAEREHLAALQKHYQTMIANFAESFSESLKRL